MKTKKLMNQDLSQKNYKQKKQNIQLAKKTYFKQYMSSEENRTFSQGEKLTGLYNRFNFLGLLEGGFYSDGYNYIEISSPENFDMSQTQEKGFTIFFWIALNKQPNNLMRYILKKGQGTSDVTPTIGLLPNNSNIFIKIYSSNQKVETIISNKKLESGKIYSISVSIGFDLNEGITEMSLYIDGILDSQISLPGTPVQNESNFFIGKYDSSCHGFIGTISEIMFIPYVLEDNEIANFLELNQFGSRIIKIKKENFSNKKEVMNQAIINQNQPKKSLKEYLDSIVYKISDYSELLKFNKKIKSNDTKIKPKYLEISELSNEFKSIEAQSFFQRKQYVQDNIDQIDYINNPTDKCLFYLKLLIRDNTNTRLIKEYLSFLKRNPQLEALNLDYKKELEYYMVCLTKSELNKLKEEKANDEKDNLIRFLSKLYEAEEKNYAKFSEEIKTKEIKNILFLISQ